MISSFFYDGKTMHKDIPSSKFKNYLRRKKGVLWVDLEMPTPQELKILSDTFNFHPLSIEDCSKFTEMPKVDEYDDYILLVFHRVTFDFKKEELQTKEMDIFLGDNFLVTVHNEESQSIENMKSRVTTKPQTLLQGPDIIMHGIIDYSIDRYIPVLDKWDEVIEDLEEKILRGETEGIMEEIMHLRRHLVEFKKSIGPQKEVINKLARRDYPYISERGSMYMKDVYDHIQSSYTELESYREMLANAFEAYLSVLSNRMNTVIHRLTLIATIFMPLTFITGLYGMNFVNMPELSWQYGYFFSLAIMTTVGVVMVLYLKKKEWM
ncbi:MAG: magnesium/cobalt transporter CorA [archaeon]